MKKLWLRSATAMVLAVAAHAGTVYDNGGPNTTNGWGIHGSQASADDFIIATGASVTQVGFYFQNFNGITGWNQQVNYAFLADNSSSPGATIASGAAQNVVAVDSGLPWCCGGGNAYLVTFDLQNPFTAAANTRYWLELTGAGGSASAAWWVTTAPNPTPVGWVGSVGNFTDRTDQLAFYLTDKSAGGSTPEPATFVLLGCGLGAAGLLRRRFVR